VIPETTANSLQKGFGEKELKAADAQGPVLELGPHLNDFADTAVTLNGYWG
jgi:hypothetical protein